MRSTKKISYVLDFELAELYGTTVKKLNATCKRHEKLLASHVRNLPADAAASIRKNNPRRKHASAPIKCYSWEACVLLASFVGNPKAAQEAVKIAQLVLKEEAARKEEIERVVTSTFASFSMSPDAWCTGNY